MDNCAHCCASLPKTFASVRYLQDITIRISSGATRLLFYIQSIGFLVIAMLIH